MEVFQEKWTTFMIHTLSITFDEFGQNEVIIDYWNEFYLISFRDISFFFLFFLFFRGNRVYVITGMKTFLLKCATILSIFGINWNSFLFIREYGK